MQKVKYTKVIFVLTLEVIERKDITCFNDQFRFVRLKKSHNLSDIWRLSVPFWKKQCKYEKVMMTTWGSWCSRRAGCTNDVQLPILGLLLPRNSANTDRCRFFHDMIFRVIELGNLRWAVHVQNRSSPKQTKQNRSDLTTGSSKLELKRVTSGAEFAGRTRLLG